MTTLSAPLPPAFPSILLSSKRQQALKKSEASPRRILEKMYAEALSNFREILNGGITAHQLDEVLAFLQSQNVSVSVAYFRGSDPGIRITSTVINTFIGIKNPDSLFLLCEMLGYKVVYNQIKDDVSDSGKTKKAAPKKPKPTKKKSVAKSTPAPKKRFASFLSMFSL
jgi:hypothetical protein